MQAYINGMSFLTTASANVLMNAFLADPRFIAAADLR